jgi:hypothetical protein
MNTITTLTPEELAKITQLYVKAQTTPMICTSMEEGLAGRDWASMAWADVRSYLNDLGKKYGYNPENMVINAKGEVLPISCVESHKEAKP